MEQLTKQTHIEIHKKLHKQLDDLVANWILETNKLPSEHTIYDLMKWAYQQTKNPSDRLGQQNEKEAYPIAEKWVDSLPNLKSWIKNKQHYKKVVEPYYSRLKNGTKLFEIRHDDGDDYAEGDTFVGALWDGKQFIVGADHPEIKATIGFLTSFGQKENTVVFSLLNMELGLVTNDGKL